MLRSIGRMQKTKTTKAAAVCQLLRSSLGSTRTVIKKRLGKRADRVCTASRCVLIYYFRKTQTLCLLFQCCCETEITLRHSVRLDCGRTADLVVSDLKFKSVVAEFSTKFSMKTGLTTMIVGTWLENSLGNDPILTFQRTHLLILS